MQMPASLLATFKAVQTSWDCKFCFCWTVQDTFGLEYDLDLFNIVAVDDFNMGAMENKSLNIFNSRLVLASPETATDMDFARIEGVVGHEYFHNWTGDRVTCRDWFQLTLKEGLTVFRDQVGRSPQLCDTCMLLCRHGGTQWMHQRAQRRVVTGKCHSCININLARPVLPTEKTKTKLATTKAWT